MAERWFAIAAETGREKIARQDLAEIIDQVWLPQQQCTFIRRGLKVGAVVPLTPGYLFGYFDVERIDWRAFNRARGVFGLVMLGNAIVAVRRNDLDRLWACEVDGVIVPAKLEAAFGVGLDIRVTSGPFTSYSGQITRAMILKGAPRYIVEVEIFGRRTKVELDQTQLQPA